MPGHHSSSINPKEIIKSYLQVEQQPENLHLRIQTLSSEEARLHYQIIKDELIRLERIRSEGFKYLSDYINTVHIRDVASKYSNGYTDLHGLTYNHEGHQFSKNGVSPNLPIDYLKELKLLLSYEKIKVKKVEGFAKQFMFYEAIRNGTLQEDPAHPKQENMPKNDSGSLDEEEKSPSIPEQEVKAHALLSKYSSEALQDIRKQIQIGERNVAMEALQSYDDTVTTNQLLVTKKQKLELENKNQSERLEESYRQNTALHHDVQLLQSQVVSSNQTVALLQAQLVEAEKRERDLNTRLIAMQRENENLRQQTKEESVEISIRVLRNLLAKYKPSIFNLFTPREVIFDNLDSLLGCHHPEGIVKLSQIKKLIAHDEQLVAIFDNPNTFSDNKKPIAAFIRELAKYNNQQFSAAQPKTHI